MPMSMVAGFLALFLKVWVEPRGAKMKSPCCAETASVPLKKVMVPLVM